MFYLLHIIFKKYFIKLNINCYKLEDFYNVLI